MIGLSSSLEYKLFKGVIHEIIIYFHLIFRCIINCEPKISPSVKLSIQAKCDGRQCSNISSYQWILYEHNSSDNVWKKIQLVTTTPSNSSSITIKEDSLEGGKNYRLVVFVNTTNGQQEMSFNNISTASPPTGGTCFITPSNGTSLETYFNLNCSDWESHSTPLSYLFQYQLLDDLHGLLYNGSNSSVNSWLPSGRSCNYTVKCSVTVTDKNGVSAPTVHLSVQVQYIFDYMESCITLQMSKALVKRPMIVDDS